MTFIRRIERTRVHLWPYAFFFFLRWLMHSGNPRTTVRGKEKLLVSEFRRRADFIWPKRASLSTPRGQEEVYKKSRMSDSLLRRDSVVNLPIYLLSLSLSL